MNKTLSEGSSAPGREERVAETAIRTGPLTCPDLITLPLAKAWRLPEIVPRGQDATPGLVTKRSTWPKENSKQQGE